VHSFDAGGPVLLALGQSASSPSASSPSVPSTPQAPVSTLPQGAGSVITIVGGPNVAVSVPGPQNDAADLFGIVPVLLGIGAAIAGARWLFGRSGGKPTDPGNPPSGSDPTPTGREAPR